MNKMPVLSDLLNEHNIPDFREKLQFNVWYRSDSKFRDYLIGYTEVEAGMIINVSIFRKRLKWFLEDHPEVSLLTTRDGLHDLVLFQK